MRTEAMSFIRQKVLLGLYTAFSLKAQRDAACNRQCSTPPSRGRLVSYRKSHCVVTGRCMTSPGKVNAPETKACRAGARGDCCDHACATRPCNGGSIFPGVGCETICAGVCRRRPAHRRLAQRQKQERRRHQTREFHDLSLPHFLFNRAISMRSPTCVPVRNTVCAGSSSTLVAFSDTAEIRNGRKCSST